MTRNHHLRVAVFAALTALVTAVMLTGCSEGSGTPAAARQDGAPLRVVTTFSVLGDITSEIGGDAVDVHSIVPLGVDPHEYSPLPGDVRKAGDSDLMVWNGLNMEVGGGWFEALVDIAGKEMGSPAVVEASTGVEPMHLGAGTEQSEVNPHAFLDPQVGMIYTENIRDGLIAADPDNADQYRKNADAYLAELREIDDLYRDRIADIPEQHRVLVVSEYAFQYMTQRYGLRAGYIWEIDTDEQGTPDQMNTLIDLVTSTGVPAVFVESNVDRRPMETISAETGVPIAGTVFSDELGSPDTDGGTYLTMLRHNIETIYAGLS